MRTRDRIRLVPLGAIKRYAVMPHLYVPSGVTPLAWSVGSVDSVPDGLLVRTASGTLAMWRSNHLEQVSQRKAQAALAAINS